MSLRLLSKVGECEESDLCVEMYRVRTPNHLSTFLLTSISNNFYSFIFILLSVRYIFVSLQSIDLYYDIPVLLIGSIFLHLYRS